MILSVSRRTDIPSFYGEWFLNRLQEGFVCVRNPFNYHQVSKIILDPSNVDCIVFWTKDARPFMDKLDAVDKLGYKYYFQYTVTPYDTEIETNVADKNIILDNFKRLSDKIGAKKVIWRYDPILYSKNIGLAYHVENFEKLSSIFKGFTHSVIISFLDDYSKVGKRTGNIQELNFEQMIEVSKAFAEIAKSKGLTIKTCAEELANTSNIAKASCIDKNLIEDIIGLRLNVQKDKNQRHECLCFESIDIGAYDTCKHFCNYCYANGSEKKIISKCIKHNPNSPLLIGEIEEGDKIIEKNLPSNKVLQQSLFD